MLTIVVLAIGFSGAAAAEPSPAERVAAELRPELEACLVNDESGAERVFAFTIDAGAVVEAGFVGGGDLGEAANACAREALGRVEAQLPPGPLRMEVHVARPGRVVAAAAAIEAKPARRRSPPQTAVEAIGDFPLGESVAAAAVSCMAGAFLGCLVGAIIEPGSWLCPGEAAFLGAAIGGAGGAVAGASVVIVEHQSRSNRGAQDDSDQAGVQY